MPGTGNGPTKSVNTSCPDFDVAVELGVKGAPSHLRKEIRPAEFRAGTVWPMYLHSCGMTFLY